MLVTLRLQQLLPEGESEFQGKGLGGGKRKIGVGGAINEFRPAGVEGGSSETELCCLCTRRE